MPTKLNSAKSKHGKLYDNRPKRVHETPQVNKAHKAKRKSHDPFIGNTEHKVKSKPMSKVKIIKPPFTKDNVSRQINQAIEQGVLVLKYEPKMLTFKVDDVVAMTFDANDVITDITLKKDAVVERIAPLPNIVDVPAPKMFKFCDLIKTRYVKGWKQMEQDERITESFKAKGQSVDGVDPDRIYFAPFKQGDESVYLIGIYE